MLLVTAAEMRQLDRLTIEKHGTPGYTLMQRAGRGATKVMLDCIPVPRRGRVVVCAGKGNNGGDGFVIARELKRRGVGVEVFLLAAKDEVRGDAARALRSYERLRGRIRCCRSAADLDAMRRAFDGAAAVVDAIFGTGLKGNVEGLPAEAIAAINAGGAPVLAVDIPSGLDGDRGVALGNAVRARVTATFGFAKVGQVVYPGREYVGRLEVVDIGIAPAAVEEVAPKHSRLDAGGTSALVPRRSPTTHKGDCGHVLILAGSRGKTGAARLCALGALRSGAGLVTVACPRSEQAVVAGGLPEAMTEGIDDEAGRIRFDPASLTALVEGKRAVVFGPGIGTHAAADETLSWLLANVHAPLLIDADGLTCLARGLDRLGQARGPVVLTPHPGEMARLLGGSAAEVQSSRVKTAAELARRHRCVVVLKGADSVVAAADGSIAINSSGNPGMASGGMGDVLSGIIGALLGQGLKPGDAAGLGVFVHGVAGDVMRQERGPIGLIASDVADALPETFDALLQAGEA